MRAEKAVRACIKSAALLTGHLGHLIAGIDHNMLVLKLKIWEKNNKINNNNNNNNNDNNDNNDKIK